MDRIILITCHHNENVWESAGTVLWKFGLLSCLLCSDNVAISSSGYGLRGGFGIPPPEARRFARRDGPAWTWPGLESWPKPGLHPFLVRTVKPGYLSAATSLQPIASRTWARFIFLYIFYFLISVLYYFDSLLSCFANYFDFDND